MTVTDRPACASSTGSGPCLSQVAYKIDKGFDRIDYACKGHLSALVKARLRGVSQVVVSKS